jgi:Polysaccharide deacetylase
MKKERPILLTFDLEEFDLPLEYDIQITKECQLTTSTDGLMTLLEILDKHKVKATFFTTAYYAENNQKIMQSLVTYGHEIASHMYYHSDYNKDHIALSRQKLIEITGIVINGFRSPRFKVLDKNWMLDAGYTYDSSINPTYLPGRYNNFKTPKTIYKDEKTGLKVLPMSVASIFRIPLFWLSFKNLPLSIYTFLSKMALQSDGYLHLYFHPWEFTDLSFFNKIPWYIKDNSGERMAFKLDKFIAKMKSNHDFLTIQEFLNTSTF